MYKARRMQQVADTVLSADSFPELPIMATTAQYSTEALFKELDSNTLHDQHKNRTVGIVSGSA